MKIAILEFISDFKALSSFVRDNNLKLSDFKIIALELKLQAYLSKRNIAFDNTLKYFDNDSHKKILLETENVLEHIEHNFSFIDHNNSGNVYEVDIVRFVRFYLNYIFRILEILSNIQKKFGKCQFYALVSDRILNTVIIEDNKKESYLGLLTESFAKENALEFYNVNADSNYPSSKLYIKKRLSVMEKIHNHLLVRYLRNRKVIFINRPTANFRKIIRNFRQRSDSLEFLAIGYESSFQSSLKHNLSTLARSVFKIKRQDSYFCIFPSFFHVNSSSDEESKLGKQIDSIFDKSKAGLFRYNGVSYFNILSSKIEFALKGYLSDMLYASSSIAYILNQIKRSIVVMYTGVPMFLASEIAKHMGRKAIFISHAVHPEPIDEYHEIELRNLGKTFMLGDYTDIALATPMQEAHLKYFKDRIKGLDARELKTGPLIFSEVTAGAGGAVRKKMGIKEDEFVILHATTQKQRGSQRYYILETSDEMFSSLSDLVQAVNGLNKARLIIRLHPGSNISDDEIRRLLPDSDKYIINREGNFEDILSASDLLVSYSSTAIDEALINNIPVLLFDKWNRYNHFNTGIFEDSKSDDIFPVCYVNSNEKLEPSILYIKDKLGQLKKKDIYFTKYKYQKDYGDNIYNFVEASLNI